ncbi:methyltransferase [Sphingomonas sp.]|uniref:class I SAM-dependent methyltransferase n=1 Tax=Sphingomonas sp. TaxID=28214 RepID=UPI001ED58B13|nr:methyltransferase [Sphingomonas sp.]MBX3593188.1 class I SAM-dependent methyltransferase [Sphingomonas sp.]
MRITPRPVALAIVIATGLVSAAAIGAPQMGSAVRDVKAAVAAPTRSPANIARDRYRHPVETLNFFGVKPGDTVVELWPGGGWYTEILAPYVARGGGTYYAAALDRLSGGTKKMIAEKPALYGKIRLAAFPAFAPTDTRVPDGSADVVLTFRNVHNWRMGYQRADKQDYAPEAFRQIFAMLKPGGVLGVVDHRLPESASDERERSSGYMKVSTIRKLAADAGFEFVAASQVNANPRDRADWPDGVWTLPPSYRLKDVDRAKYEAIGESDRMTLKFRKPKRVR